MNQINKKQYLCPELTIGEMDVKDVLVASDASDGWGNDMFEPIGLSQGL